MFTDLHTHGYMLSDMAASEGSTHVRPKLRDNWIVNCDTSHVTATLKGLDYAQIAVAFKVRVITNKKYF
jgi:hypothetical protein